MLNSILSHIFHCENILEQNTNIILLSTFLISYIIFNYMFKPNKEEINNIWQKQRIAETYLKYHEKEDREFFTGEADELNN